jgi:TctA family transporter
MSSNQETMRTSILAAAKQRLADFMTAIVKAQSTVAVASSAVGYIPGMPGAAAATYVAAVKAANVAKIADTFTAEQTRQGAVAVAKDLLRSQGEIAW